MDVAGRRVLIERYKAGYGAVVEALRAVAQAQLDLRPAPGEWSAREAVHHLADSELTGAVRLRRLLVEEGPTIAGYDEAEYARRLRYDRRPIEPALDVIRAVQTMNAALLETLDADDWGRVGTHTGSGRYGVEDWLEIHATHCHDHAEQIRRALGTGAAPAEPRPSNATP